MKMKPHFLTFLILYSFGSNLQLVSSGKVLQIVDNGDLHLPTSVNPFHQFVHLQPFYNGQKITLGYTEISFRATEATSEITFHVANLNIDETSIKVTDKNIVKEILIRGFYYNKEMQKYTVILNSKALHPGPNYTISMNFTASLNDNLFGFYSSYYKDEYGKLVDFAVSQFAPIYARWSFPCFDEPAKKVKFSIEIEAPNNLTALSNMPVASSKQSSVNPFWRVDTFEESPIMSPYLVVFLVGDFVNQSVVVDNVTYGVWATRSSINQSSYALNIAPNVTRFYDDYFHILYSSMMPKLDMAAVPDFSFNAMENWGFIIYRESILLYDNKLSSAYDKQRTCEVVAHELAHNWFGNLVTFEWWNDVWLNEGFASFFEYLGCNAVEPTFGVPGHFLLRDLYPSFVDDSFVSSKPLSPNITSINEINNVYTTIPYSKGASVIRMMDSFLTPSTFQQGLRNYLKAFSYSNVQHDDLWSALTEQGHADGTLNSNFTMKEIMDPWTLQPGYPVLYVEKFNNGTIHLTQNRFLQSSNSSLEDVTWWIPLSYVTQGDPNFNRTEVRHWMTEQSLILPDEPGMDPDQWIIFNVQQFGYYRVNYDSENWNKLITQFRENSSIIDFHNRAQILDDGYSLARAGALDYDTILNLNVYLVNEDEYVPMKTAFDSLNYLYMMMQRSLTRLAFQHYMLSLVVPLYQDYGFDDSLLDPHSVQLKRALLVDWACKLEHQTCTGNAIDLYNTWMKNPTSQSLISPNLRSSVYCAAIGEGSALHWNFAYKRYLSSNIGKQKSHLIYGMGCTTREKLVNRYLNLTFNATSGIRMQDVENVFKSLAKNLYGRDLAWEFIQNNSDTIASHMGSYQHVVDLTDIVTETFNTEQDLREVEQFEMDQLIDLGFNLDQSKEKVQNNIDWMSAYYDVINVWLPKTHNVLLVTS